MINYILKRKNLIKRKLPARLSVKETEDAFIIMQCIRLFNKDVQWVGMFDVFDAIRRIQDGQKMFVATMNYEIFGHCWVEKRSSKEYYIYNVFSKKTNEPREYGATDMLYYVIKNHTKGKIRVRVDSWNKKSIRVFNKLGFKIEV